MKKIISIDHHACDYECMWNGIEDIFQQKSGQKVPDHFFFCLSGIGNFIYLKFSQGNLKRFASWNDGRTKQMYKSVSDIIGLRYKHIEGRRFTYAMQKAKEQIDQGKPVVLGCLDMFYLQYYPKIYHKQHIPIHYVLMVGYDDEKECVYVFDCGLEEMQEISYELLEKAMDVEKTNLGEKNAICTIDFEDNLSRVIDIAKKGFYQKARTMLEPPIGHIGIPGMRKLAKEIGNWKAELTKAEYENALRNIVMHTGTVPAPPNRLIGIAGDDNIMHMAAREKLARLFKQLGTDYGIEPWVEAAQFFLESGDLIESMTNGIVAFLLGECSELCGVSDLVLKTADIEEKAFQRITLGCV